jgi:hypothetical protein
MKRPRRPQMRQRSTTNGCCSSLNATVEGVFTGVAASAGPHEDNAGEVIEREP